jgi:hypothetical protein
MDDGAGRTESPAAATLEMDAARKSGHRRPRKLAGDGARWRSEANLVWRACLNDTTTDVLVDQI